MRNIKLKFVIAIVFTSSYFITFSQNWQLGGNGSPPLNGANNILGTFSNYPIRIYTGGTHIAQFTTGSSLNCLVGNNGDGLRIRNTYPSGVGGNLDLFTSYSNGQNETIF